MIKFISPIFVVGCVYYVFYYWITIKPLMSDFILKIYYICLGTRRCVKNSTSTKYKNISQHINNDLIS